MNFGRLTIVLGLILAVIVPFAVMEGFESAKVGTVTVQYVRNKYVKTIKPSDGWVWVGYSLGADYINVNTRSFTYYTYAKGITSDNAPVNVTLAFNLHPDESNINNYLQKFGFDEDERWSRMTAILATQANTEGKNTLVDANAYGILKNQEGMQKYLMEKLSPIFQKETFTVLETVAILNRPDFEDDRIDQAGSAVVANQQLKIAAEMAYEAAKVDAEKKKLEAETYSNPQMLKIKELELERDIEEKRANGIANFKGQTLYIGNTLPSNVNMVNK